MSGVTDSPEIDEGRRKVRLRRVLDSWRFWTLVAWIVLALLVIWLLVTNARLNDNIDETQEATRANTEAIAFLCDTNAIVQALAAQTVLFLRSEQKQDPDPDRQVTIEVFDGFVGVLEERAACVNSERQAIP
jgi:heme/copper-type cytochrome/quinol oxidase subunit 2